MSNLSPVPKGLIFAFMAAPGRSESQALVLADSVRTFAGEFSNSPIWILIPETEESISEKTREELASLNARLVPFGIDPAAREFPFAAKVFASAAAESLARGQTDLLVWMDSGSIVINAPKGLLLENGKNLGYRPVDHTLIGSPYDEPIDSFWELIYRKCHVPQDRLFPMTAVVDENRIRPYFNAGLLVVRPERGLLQLWRDNFDRLYREACFEELYQREVLYKIFIHQAVLAGTILASTGQQELQELGHLINYPLHMHAEYPAGRRPAYMDELVTCRYEAFFQKPDWRKTIAIKEPLKGWLVRHFLPRPLMRKVDCVRLYVPDLDTGLAYYRDQLGHELAWRTGREVGLRMPDTDAEIVLHTERREPEIDLVVDSADAAAKRVERAGGAIVAGPFDIQIGRCVVVQDPWGNQLVLLDTSKGLLVTDADGNVIDTQPSSPPCEGKR